MKDILRVKNLNKSYKNFSLTDVSFSLSEGCITGFIGINGAGKTTTLRTILDLAKKDSLCTCAEQIIGNPFIDNLKPHFTNYLAQMLRLFFRR